MAIVLDEYGDITGIVTIEDVLEEIDGPMLKHGIQEMHNQDLILPASKMNHSNKDKLAWRYEIFLNY